MRGEKKEGRTEERIRVRRADLRRTRDKKREGGENRGNSRRGKGRCRKKGRNGAEKRGRRVQKNRK